MDSRSDHESAADAVARIERALQSRCDLAAACVSAVAGRGAPHVLAGFLVDARSEPVAPQRLRGGERGVSVLVVPAGAVAVEDGGFAGCAPDTLQRLSQGTRAAAVTWNDWGDFGVGFARDGEVLAGTGDGFPTGGDIDPEVAAAVAGLDPRALGPRSCGLLAVERFTGVRIDAEPLPAPPAVHPLPDPTRLAPAPALAVKATPVHTGEDDDRDALSAAIAGLPPHAQRRVAAAAAAALLGMTGQRDDPALAEVLELLVHPDGPRFSEPVEIAVLRACAAEERGVVDPKLRALRVLATAANPDAHRAAVEAVWATRELLTPAAAPAFDANVQRLIARLAGGGAP